MRASARQTIDRSVLDRWDAQIVERVDRIRSSPADERVPLTLRMSAGCLGSLDETLNELRKRSRNRGVAARAAGAELAELRSAAVELAVATYVEGARGRHRSRSSATLVRTGDDRRAPGKTFVGLLSRELVDELDALLADLLGGVGGARYVSETELRDARDVVVESSVTAWLMLRGYSAIVPSAGRVRGWRGALRLLASRRHR